MRMLLQSEMRMLLVRGEKHILCGLSNWPGPLPLLPNSVRNAAVPSLPSAYTLIFCVPLDTTNEEPSALIAKPLLKQWCRTSSVRTSVPRMVQPA